MKIAVVGGGLFGVSAAFILARNNHQVTLFEKESDILQAASGINHYRLHRGYHYPRSKETILSSLEGEKTFDREFASAIMDNKKIENYYCFARERTMTTAEQASRIWKSCNLEHTPIELSFANKKTIAQSFKVKERIIDVEKLRAICWNKLRKHNVKVQLNHEAALQDLKGYDFIVIATYASNNKLLKNHPQHQKEYQFEISEKLIVQLPAVFKNKSIVVLDGPFTCFDPYSSTGYHIIGNVVHGTHTRNIHYYPDIPKEFSSVLNKGIIKNPPISNAEKILAAAEEFFPGIQTSKYLGSMFTVRTVLPKREHDDARPTLVEPLDEKHIRVFSGKLGTCIVAAEEVLKLIEAKEIQQHNAYK